MSAADTSAPMGLLVDANVWLDNYIPTRKGFGQAGRFLRFARSDGFQLLYAVGSLKDVFYIIAQSYKSCLRAEGVPVGEAESLAAWRLAWLCVENMRELACVVGADELDVWLAAKYRTLHGDLGDDLVLAAAQRSNAAYLLPMTRGSSRKPPVAAMTPQDWLDLQGCVG